MTATLDELRPQTPFRRPTWREAVAEYLPERWRARGQRWATHLPVAVFALLGALLALRLGRTAFIDEALYINAGQDYLTSWRLGTPAPDHARVFSGAPVFYPVIAATLDAVGGLRLVRAFSLVLIALSTFGIAGVTRALFGFRAGVFAAAAFALTGPVIFVGALGTFDALCIALLTAALWVGVTRHGWTSALVCALLLAVAPVAKYAGVVFLPAVWWVVACSRVQPVGSRRPTARALGRAAVVAAISSGLLVATYVVLADDTVRQGIAFTTSARQALSPVGPELLTVLLLANVGLLVVLALAALWLLRRPPRLLLLAVGLFGAAAALPAAQFRLGEGVSFDKHSAYAALFLAPLAGVALQRLSRRTYRLGPPLLVLLLVLVSGGVRSGMLHREWPDVSPMVAQLGPEAPAGIYLSSSADVLEYYTRRDQPQVVWETTFELYSYGEATIRQAVADGRYVTIILRSSSTSSPQQDAGQQALLDALADSSLYRQLRSVPVDEWGTDRWLVFQRSANAVAAPTAPAAPPASPAAPAPDVRPQLEQPPVIPPIDAPAAPRVEPTPPGTTSPEAVAPDAAEADALREGLRRGDRGEAVRRWQRFLREWDARALPRFGVDGLFGPETEEWTEQYLAR